jgi:hypothetical protein
MSDQNPEHETIPKPDFYIQGVEIESGLSLDRKCLRDGIVKA